jgi:hypothetical protein
MSVQCVLCALYRLPAITISHTHIFVCTAQYVYALHKTTMAYIDVLHLHETH